MIAAQYKIILADNYDMNIIRERVKNSGHKMNGFEGLNFKLYLIGEKGKSNNKNSYAPLYLWDDSKGLNNFLFKGSYDNILNSFGWQHVNIGIPLINTMKSNIKEKKYVVEIVKEIKVRKSLNNLEEKIKSEIQDIEETEYIVIYNPDKWKYHVLYLINDLDKNSIINGKVYEILYVAQ